MTVKRILDISRRLVKFSRVGDEPRYGFAIDEATTFTGVTSLAAVVGDERPAYLVSASVFADSRSPEELQALGTALRLTGRGASNR